MTFPFGINNFEDMKIIVREGEKERHEDVEFQRDRQAVFEHAMARAKAGRDKNSITREPNTDEG